MDAISASIPFTCAKWVIPKNKVAFCDISDYLSLGSLVQSMLSILSITLQQTSAIYNYHDIQEKNGVLRLTRRKIMAFFYKWDFEVNF